MIIPPSRTFTVSQWSSIQRIQDTLWTSCSPTTMSFPKLSLLVLLSSWSTLVLTAGAGIHKQIKDLIESNSPLLQYPTQVTQDIVPKRIHSHNDCASYAPTSRGFATRLTVNLDWREVPLLTALSYGVASVEADVWLLDGVLLVRTASAPSTGAPTRYLWSGIPQVGHDPESLTADRTFGSLYVQPLLKILNSQNPDTVYTRAAPRRIK